MSHPRMANFVQHITARWAATGINHEMPKAEGMEPILSIVSNGYGRVFVVDAENNKLVEFESDATEAIRMASEWIADFFIEAIEY